MDQSLPRHRRPTRGRGLRLAAVAAAVALLASACAGEAADDPDAPPEPSGATEAATASTDPSDAPTTPQDPAVQLVTHDSFAISDDVLAAFTDQTGYEVEVLRSGDAGATVNAAVLTAGNPQGDVLFGVDNTLLSRALDAEVFVPHEPAEADALDPALVLDDQWRVTPIDRGDVCLNYDVSAYTDGEPPSTLDDLTEPDYAGQLVVENPATSSPGLAFLLATYSTFGEDGWEQYWEDLVANDVAVSAGWEDAYYGVFSGAAGSEGDRPLVVSYASSPPAEVIFAEEELDEAPTGVITASCFQQVEFAGVLAGTDNEAGARALVDFMVQPEFQADIPLQMFVFPARTDVELPPEFVEYSAVPDDPITMDPATIDDRREELVQRWTEIVLG
ncbi:thiamine ABC transporter substrate-binding protein [Salsipaludibacter albus]|uniref:thiamine ABC transporter substrate-binding protein n=1 Tax=Salsipaludibacter albus TaxID=2849650 RepID=UPI001EE4758E|nr:thiamine ABC transporter substrate-binding protein [Salsipaludibacter albus]MBY5162488.1 thiamine ABC transporter substrate-binding protein [Salsipaludibacter albus]